MRLSDVTRPVFWHDEATTLMHVSNGYQLSWKLENRIVTMGEIRATWQSATADSNVPTIVTSLTAFDPHEAPAINLLSYAFGQVFGFSVQSLRFLPAIIGVLCIPASFWLGVELSSIPCALLMATFVAFSPFGLHHAQELRHYSNYLFWMFVTSSCFLLALRTSKRSHWISYGVSYALMIYAHLFAIFLGIGHTSYAFIASKLKSTFAEPQNANFKRTLIATTLAYIAFLPWAWIILSKWGYLNRLGSFILSESSVDKSLAQAWLAAPGALFVYATPLEKEDPLSYVVFAIVLLSVFVVWKVERRAALYLSAVFLAYALTLYGSDAFLGSQFSVYYKFLLPIPVVGLCFVSIALGHGFESNRRWLKSLAVVGTAAILCCEACSCRREFSDPERFALHGIRLGEIADVLKRNPDVLLIVCESGEFINKNQLAALSHRVSPEFKVMWIPDSNWQKVPTEIKRMFTFNPPKEFLEAARKAGYTVSPTAANALFEMRR